MLRKISITIADKLIASGFDYNQREIIAYGAECTLSELLANAILIIIAYLLHLLPATLIWLIFFTTLRIHVGGYHASNHTLCILESTIIGILCSFLSTQFTYSFLCMFIILFLSFAAILKYAPVVHPNHPISQTYQHILLHRSLLILAIESSLSILFFLLLPLVYATVMINSILSCVLLMVFGHYYTKIANKIH